MAVPPADAANRKVGPNEERKKLFLFVTDIKAAFVFLPLFLQCMYYNSRVQ